MTTMTIGTVATEAGIRPSAIRYYEEIGLLPQPERTSGQRRYDPAILFRLAVIRTAQGLGFSIAELKDLFASEREGVPSSRRWHDLAERKMAELDDLIDGAQRMRATLRESLSCGCLRFEDCQLIC